MRGVCYHGRPKDPHPLIAGHQSGEKDHRGSESYEAARTLSEMVHGKDPISHEGMRLHVSEKPACEARALNEGKAKAHESSPEECSTEIVSTIVVGYIKGISHVRWKVRVRGTWQVISNDNGDPVIVLTITFSELEERPITTSNDDPLVVKLKVTSALVRRILINTGSSIDIIT
ncbi:hypothetical protein Cgig2_001955 [Carnegiea gigantea]|uniref:Uncharacterized protein n=1 Tax=Carnegiea gigantea TaxID=171969 RepID=A0A9Q1JV81_9CARY|nr:hypothetical protein Cgig2_001955 [Carnegiea gigantea]